MNASAPRVRDSAPHRALLQDLFFAAVNTATPSVCLPRHLPPRPGGRVVVIGAGKAAAAMASVAEQYYPQASGVVVTRYGHAVPCRAVTVLEAAHPMPDQAGIEASRAIMDAVAGLTEADLVLCLLSGGGSSLLSMPPPSVTLEDERALAKALLRSGASIAEINCVRKHTSLIKGGRLGLAAYPAQVVTLIISDVPDDDAATVASGPTIVDATSSADALEVIARYGIELPAGLLSWLVSPLSASPDADALAHCSHTVVATASDALAAAARMASDAGYNPLLLGEALEGEARTVGAVQAGMVRSVIAGSAPVSAPAVLLSGGETTVTVRGNGRGGRNAEFLLGLLTGLQGVDCFHAIAADTDGIDGSEANAGAFIDGDSLTRAEVCGVSAEAHLDDNDAYGFFATLDDLFVTGPTMTNVNDFRAILIDPPMPECETS